MLPEASEAMSLFVQILSIIAIVYTSIVALAQEDMKKLIAYSSVAHMGYVTLGIFSLNGLGVNGAIFQMLSHKRDFCRAVPHRRGRLRPPAHADDLALWRDRRDHAALRDCVHGVHDGFGRPPGTALRR